jgi:hypothetical protein
MSNLQSDATGAEWIRLDEPYQISEWKKFLHSKDTLQARTTAKHKMTQKWPASETAHCWRKLKMLLPHSPPPRSSSTIFCSTKIIRKLSPLPWYIKIYNGQFTIQIWRNLNFLSKCITLTFPPFLALTFSCHQQTSSLPLCWLHQHASLQPYT